MPKKIRELIRKLKKAGFVVRVGQDLHKALAIGAMRHGESLNEHCLPLLREEQEYYGKNRGNGE